MTRGLKSLYWCFARPTLPGVEVAIEGEDWFVVATSMQEARRLHAQFEGRAFESVDVTLVVALPAEWQTRQRVGRPRNVDELFAAVGGVRLRYKSSLPARTIELQHETARVTPQAWKFGDRVFVSEPDGRGRSLDW